MHVTTSISWIGYLLIWACTWQPRFHVVLSAHAPFWTKGPSWIYKFKRMYGKKVVTWYDPWLL